MKPLKNHDKTIIERKAEQTQASRSDVAEITGSLQSLLKQANKTRQQLEQQFINSPILSEESANQMLTERIRLTSINKKIAEIKKELEDHVPDPKSFKAKLSEEEKNQIRHLYLSGRYTQRELSEQYGVAQPTVSEIVNKETNNEN